MPTMMQLPIYLIAFLLLACSKQGVNPENTPPVNITDQKQYNNPIITHKFTADPAALVHEGTVYLYTGHDEAELDYNFYKMNEWLVFSSTNMIDWEEHPVPLQISDFDWAKADAW
ncbi:MAG: hypothetical protein KDC44_17280, partial [Phaeodactylibacter sp.]|nr:hypothetical protein [Phaeodactylibacter sp.]